MVSVWGPEAHLLRVYEDSIQHGEKLVDFFVAEPLHNESVQFDDQRYESISETERFLGEKDLLGSPVLGRRAADHEALFLEKIDHSRDRWPVLERSFCQTNLGLAVFNPKGPEDDPLVNRNVESAISKFLSHHCLYGCKRSVEHETEGFVQRKVFPVIFHRISDF